MKNLILIFGIGLISINTLIGLIFSSYSIINWVVNDVIIISNSLALYYLSISKQKDAFKISISFLTVILGIIQFILCLFMPQTIENNFILISIVGILVIEVFLISITSYFSKHV
jgi:hypothetical protein